MTEHAVIRLAEAMERLAAALEAAAGATTTPVEEPPGRIIPKGGRRD